MNGKETVELFKLWFQAMSILLNSESETFWTDCYGSHKQTLRMIGENDYLDFASTLWFI